MTVTLGTARALAGAALLVALAGCGGASSSGGPSATDSSSPSSPGSGPVDATTIAVLSQTAAGGMVSPMAVRLDTTGQIRAFTAPLMQRGLGPRVMKALAKAQVPPGSHVYGAIVSIGCDVPPGVDVVRSGDGVRIVAQEVESPKPECLAPVTTVGLVAVAS